MNTIYIGTTLINDMFLGSGKITDLQAIKPNLSIEYLVIGSGGYGASGNNSNQARGGGGGAGGLLSGSAILLPGTTYQVQVGNALLSGGFDSYLTGSNLYFYSYAGGKGNGGTPAGTGGNGGSGAGGSQCTATLGCTRSGGTAVAGQGNVGGIGQYQGPSNQAGGGGGAGSAGVNGASGGAGGSGLASSISGTSITYSVGGSGGVGVVNGSTAGSGGGGGLYTPSTNPGSGADGIVIIRYKGPQQFTGGTVTTDGAYTVQTFTWNPADGLDPTKYTFTY
jgi:hypothetical protein